MSQREIKSAVTILHRIAVNQKHPIMLMQAQLFQIFKHVINAPTDPRHEELKKLAIFVTRQFVKIAAKNPKIYAELLFFKSHRECYEIEFGYNDEHGGGHETKGTSWSEAQEEQLRGLYTLNQESPQTDQDVIDWIVENLHDKSRNRRNVIKKLKELGLIFKAPTKRSNAAGMNRNVFIKDEDERLVALYDEHRMEVNCLARIMEVFKGKRSKHVVVRRMVQLGLVADESEIMPAKMRRGKNNRENSENYQNDENDENSQSSDSNDDEPQRPTTNRTSNHAFNYATSQRLKNELEESLKEAIEWIIESLNEAAEDFEGPSDDASDAIPLVPFIEAQKSALENEQFVELLRGIGMVEPVGNEVYWKIPADMMPWELKERVSMLRGEVAGRSSDVGGVMGDGGAQNRLMDSESEDDEDIFVRLKRQHQALAYNNSDDDEDRSCGGKNASVASKTRKILSDSDDSKDDDNLSKNGSVKSMATNGSGMNDTGVSRKSSKKTASSRNSSMASRKTRSSSTVSRGSSTVTQNSSILSQNSENSKNSSKMSRNSSKVSQNSTLNDTNVARSQRSSSTSSNSTTKSSNSASKASDSDETIRNASVMSRISSKRQIDTDSDDEPAMIIKKKRTKHQQDSEEIAMNTQELKQQLAELGESSDDDDDEKVKTVEKVEKVTSKRKVLESSDDEGDDGGGKNDGGHDINVTNENEMNANNASKMRKVRRIVDSDDE
jgi:timeless